MLDKSTARDILQRAEVPIGAGFHTLSWRQVEALLGEAREHRYRQPVNANGSLVRYFHDYVQRRAQKQEA